jgi:hypothetical protein
MGKEKEEDPKQNVQNVGKICVDSAFLSVSVLHDSIS